MSSPWPPTGVAAPMFVPGAIVATCAARVMNVPALAARAPAGADPDDRPAAARRGASTRCRGWRPGCRPACSSWITTAAAPSRSRLGDAVGEVARHDLVDDAGRGQDHDARAAGRLATARPRRPAMPPGQRPAAASDRQGAQRQREHEDKPSEATEHADPPVRAYRIAAASRHSNTSRLHVSRSSPTAATSASVANAAAQLVASRGRPPADRRRRPRRPRPGGRRRRRSCRR